MMAYLRALPAVLVRRYAGRTIVCDQGPMYLLARPGLRDPRLAHWSAETFAVYAGLIDVAVWLDAPDSVLAERIATRSTPHRLQGAAPDRAAAVLAQARADFAPMFATLDADQATIVLRFDTSLTTTADVVDAVIEALTERRHRASGLGLTRTEYHTKMSR
jgi:hypothetical protein